MDGIQYFFCLDLYTLIAPYKRKKTNPLLRSIESGSSLRAAQISPTVLSILKGVYEHKTNFSSLRLLLYITLTSVTITLK
jgi:hypothetical protein